MCVCGCMCFGESVSMQAQGETHERVLGELLPSLPCLPWQEVGSSNCSNKYWNDLCQITPLWVLVFISIYLEG